MNLVFSTKNQVKASSYVITEKNQKNMEQENYINSISKTFDNSFNNKSNPFTTTLSFSNKSIFSKQNYNMFESIKPTRECNCGK
jgi:hypothetical protein